MSSRKRILEGLKRENRPFPEAPELASYRPMVPVADKSAAALRSLFMREAGKAGCAVYQPVTAPEAIGVILQIVGDDTTVACWEPDKIPLPGLEQALDLAGIRRVGQDSSVRVGLTGVNAALAATGSLVLGSGPGQYRAASLLPTVHVAVVTGTQIMPDLESWFAAQREDGLDQMRWASNIVVVSGPSCTADIALQLVMGMHGPRELHIVLVEESG